jgi:hypothetical protein
MAGAQIILNFEADMKILPAVQSLLGLLPTAEEMKKVTAYVRNLAGPKYALKDSSDNVSVISEPPETVEVAFMKNKKMLSEVKVGRPEQYVFAMASVSDMSSVLSCLVAFYPRLLTILLSMIYFYR